MHRVTPVLDSAGKVVNYVMQPIMVELRQRDLMQIVVGAALLALPVAFTEEVWVLAEELPNMNVFFIWLTSVVFLSGFVYYNFYRNNLRDHIFSFIKRIVITYALTLFVVSLLLLLIEKFPYETDPVLALKRVVIVAFPATMAASLTDSIK